MSDPAARSQFPALPGVLSLRVRWSAVGLGAALTLVAFAALLTLALVLTTTYRAALADSAAAADVVWLVGAALVLSSALGGFAAGLRAHASDPTASGFHAALSSLGAFAVIGAVGLPVPATPALHAPLAMSLFAVCAVVASIIGGRYGARSNAADEAA